MDARACQLEMDFSRMPVDRTLTPIEQEQLVQSVLQEALTAFPLKKAPTVEWRRYRTTAGTAQCERCVIGLSRSILNTEERLRSTLLHEYAHLLAYHRAGRAGKGHGPAWKKAMADLGLPPEVHHRYDCKRNKPRQQAMYQCKRCGEQFARARRLPRRRKYLHLGCGGAIQFLRVEQIPS